MGRHLQKRAKQRMSEIRDAKTFLFRPPPRIHPRVPPPITVRPSLSTPSQKSIGERTNSTMSSSDVVPAAARMTSIPEKKRAMTADHRRTETADADEPSSSSQSAKSIRETSSQISSIRPSRRVRHKRYRSEGKLHKRNRLETHKQVADLMQRRFVDLLRTRVSPVTKLNLSNPQFKYVFTCLKVS